MVTVGGWNDPGGLKAVVGGTPDVQKTWANNLNDFLNTYGYAGVGKFLPPPSL